jgi:hypothetical protein
MQEPWSPRKLLICKFLLLNQQGVFGDLTPRSLFFNFDYPDPMLLWNEPSRVMECLLDLEKSGYIQLTDIKINRLYPDIYRNDEFPELRKAAQPANYGLSRDILTKVENERGLTTAELVSVLDLNMKPPDSLNTLQTYLFAASELKLSAKDLRDCQIKYLLVFPYVIAQNLSFSITVNQKKLAGDFDAYIKAFREGQAHSKNASRYFTFDFQRELLRAALSKLAQKYGLSNLEWPVGYWDIRIKPDSTEADDELLSLMKTEYSSAYRSWYSGNEKGQQRSPLEFYETLFALEKEDIIKITDIKSELLAMFQRPLSYKLNEGCQVLTNFTLNVKAEFLNQPIAPIAFNGTPPLITEPSAKMPGSPGSYVIEYIGCRIIINDIINDKYLLSTLLLGYDTDLVFQYVYNHPNTTLYRERVEEDIKKLDKKFTIDKTRFNKIVDTIGFTGPLRNLFFDTSQNAIEFRNNLNKEKLKMLGIDEKQLKQQIAKLPKIL